MTEVLSIPKNEAEGADRRVTVYDHHVVDPYIDNTEFVQITAQLRQREAEGYYGDSSIDIARKRPGDIDTNNPATRWMYENLPGFPEWHSLVPTAAALEPLYNPEITTLANGKEFTAEMRQWMSNIYDAIGIRSRAEVMKNIVVGEVLRAPDNRRKWVSLGCGAAQPVMVALDRIRESDAVVPDVTLVDIQKEALTLAMNGAQQAGFADNVTTKRMNILNPNGIAAERDEKAGFYSNILRMGNKLPAESFDMVDAVGILEYLKPGDWKYAYGNVIKTKRGMAGARSFLHNAFELVTPGGQLIVGNMRDTHPQLGFTLNTIQWPHIQPRSVDEMVQLIREAGLEGQIDVHCPDDNVYAIYVIHKD